MTRPSKMANDLADPALARVADHQDLELRRLVAGLGQRGQSCARLDGNLDASISRPADLGEESWRVADALGWAKTYGAEYVALAKLLRCRLVTADARLRRATRRLGFVVALTEL